MTARLAIAVIVGSFVVSTSTARASPAAMHCDEREELAIAIEKADAVVLAEVESAEDDVTALPDGDWGGEAYPRKETKFTRNYRVIEVLKGEVSTKKVHHGGTCTTSMPGYPQCRVPAAHPKGSQLILFLRRDGLEMRPRTYPVMRYGAGCPSAQNAEGTLAAYPNVVQRILGAPVTPKKSDDGTASADEPEPPPVEPTVIDDDSGIPPRQEIVAPPSTSAGPRGCSCRLDATSETDGLDGAWSLLALVGWGLRRRAGQGVKTTLPRA